MALFKRKTRGGAAQTQPDGTPGSDSGSINKEKKPFAQRKPANTAFKQQRLKAWQPILTPRTVLPTLFLLGILFAPIGAVLYYFSNTVSEITIEYSDCSSLTEGSNEAIPSGKYSYHLKGITASNFQLPRWEKVANTSAPNGYTCQVFFSIPTDLQPSVFLYYKLTNFYQNHRRYVKSIDSEQLLGEVRTASELNSGQCKPVAEQDGLAIYPCGLIANSVFNDTFSAPILLNSATAGTAYNMSETNIVWPGEKNKYAATTMSPSELIPPPYWQGATGPFGVPSGQYFANGTNLFDPSTNEHFMVWMRTAGLPTFRKLYSRNDDDVMTAGYYRIDIEDNYPVTMFHGTKSIVISTVSWIGGRNSFLGLAYIVVAGILVLLGLVFTAHHVIKPRKLGDMSLLSWNQEDK